MSLLAAAATALTITVRVYDLYGLSPEERARALAVAGETLARAHVSVVWHDCHRDSRKVLPPACADVLKRGEMVLRFQRRTDRG